MSQDTAVALATWIVGDRPPAVVMGEHFVPVYIDKEAMPVTISFGYVIRMADCLWLIC